MLRMDTGTRTLDSAALSAWADALWEEDILPVISEYIAIPNKSPLFDSDWVAKGHMARAVTLLADWCRSRSIPGLEVELLQPEGRTPLLKIELPGEGEGTVLLYGHLDKQPEMVGWREGLDPWKPVREGDKLYGRGGADDGYSVFAALTALEGLHRFGGRHARCVVLIEAGEESGSPDLPAYIEYLAPGLGEVDLVVCLDSGCGDYERLWGTTSLRGMVGGELSVRILEEGVHSGDASGIVPSTFRILRSILDRVEDPATGRLRIPEFHCEIPPERVEQARAVAAILGEQVWRQFPFLHGARPVGEELHQMVLDRTWRPSLCVTGAAGLPSLTDAGNVLRPETSVKLSFRLPPTVDWEEVVPPLEQVLEAEPPYGAEVRFEAEKGGNGWNAPPFAPWLERALDDSSRTFFGNPPAFMGEGGSIPFMAMLGERFPQAQFLITGVLGPQSNAHGPNEFLHIPFAKKLSCCVAAVIDAHFRARAAENGG